jgi:hypothetical protein
MDRDLGKGFMREEESGKSLLGAGAKGRLRLPKEASADPKGAPQHEMGDTVHPLCLFLCHGHGGG